MSNNATPNTSRSTCAQDPIGGKYVKKAPAKYIPQKARCRASLGTIFLEKTNECMVSAMLFLKIATNSRKSRSSRKKTLFGDRCQLSTKIHRNAPTKGNY